jgi:transcriptional regulator with XRE-family HTH domain
MTISQRIDELVVRHGSLRAVARVLRMDAGYLSRLRSGEKENPDKGTLKKLGLKKIVTYEALK